MSFMEAILDPFACLANPIRRGVLDALRGGPLTVEQLWDRVTEVKKVSRSSFSEHLQVLRQARMVAVLARRTERIYSLNQEGFTPVLDWVQVYEVFWDEKLTSLGKYLEKGAHREDA